MSRGGNYSMLTQTQQRVKEEGKTQATSACSAGTRYANIYA